MPAQGAHYDNLTQYWPGSRALASPTHINTTRARSPACRCWLSTGQIARRSSPCRERKILEFTPAGSHPLLWLSPRARFEAGQAIRGGIPLCAPWFGPHPADSNKPNHGFARNLPWQLTAATVTEGDELSLCFDLRADEYSRRLYPFDFALQLELRLGTTLTLALTISNHSAETMPVSWALHSYFPVDELAKVRLSGLSGLASVDNTNGQSLPPLAGELIFSGEVDRFFTGAPKRLQLNSQPPLIIEGDNCPTVITWNPGRDKAAQMADIGAEHIAGLCLRRTRRGL